MAELRFDITGNTTGAQRAVKDLAGATDLASRGARLLADSLDKQKRAAAASAGATIAAAKADKILADASDEAIGSFVAEKEAIDRDRKAKEENALASAAMAKSSKGAASGAAAMVSPMGALVGAGVALAPLIVTVGTGLAGLGIAAAGIVSPIIKAAQSTGGLKANLDKLDPAQRQVAQSVLGLQKSYDQFQKSLEPVLLKDFNAAISAAKPLLTGIEPVAKATGNALAFMFKQLGATFQSAEFKQFFQFMATTAGPDVRQLTGLIVDLAKALPPLLEDLQPVASGLLALADGAAKAAKGYADFIKAQAQKGDQPGSFGKQIRNLAHDLLRTSVNADQLKASQDSLNKRFSDGRIAAADLIHPIGTFTGGMQAAKTATDNEKVAVNQLVTALQALSGGLLTTEQDQVSWRQAQQAATQAIKANTGSLDSNRGTALAARSAIIQSTQAAVTFANQELKTKDGVSKASDIIQAQIRWLQTHAGKSKIAAQEVDALRQALAKLKNKAVTLTETGTGHFSIFGRNSSSTPKLAGGAAGLFINSGTSATADDVLVRASKGELIVPANMVNAGAVDHLRGSIPGFAGGGLAGLAGRTTGFAGRFESQFTGAMKAAMTAAMRSAISAARAAASAAAAGTAGAGVQQWRGLVLRALAMEGLSAGLVNDVLYQMQTESGGNPRAINLTDINAQMGTPSKGLMQVIGPTFDYWHWPGTSWDIYNPLANIAAALNYASHGKGFGSGIGQIGSGHGYDHGGYLPTGLSLAWNNTGRPEQVIPHGRGSGQRVVVEFRSTSASEHDRYLMNWLQRAVRTNGGGDVQVAFGTSS